MLDKLLYGISWTYAEKVLVQGLSFIVSIVLARLLSVDDFGIVAVIMVFIVICDSLATGGLSNALVQKLNADRKDFDTVCILSLVISLCLYAGLFLAAPYIENFYGMPGLSVLTRVLGVRIIISAFNSIQQAYVQRELAFKKIFWSSFAGSAASAAVGIGMAVCGMGVWSLVAQYLMSSIISMFVLFMLIEWKPSLNFSLNSVRELWLYGSKILLGTITYTFKDSIRSLIIGKFYSPADLALYNQGQKFPNVIMSNIIESIGNVLFPVMAKEQNDFKTIKSMMRKTINSSAYILSPMLLGMIGAAHSFVVVLLTEKWEGAVVYMQILCLVYLTRPLSTVFKNALMAIGKSGIFLLHETITSWMTIFMIVVAITVFDSILLVAWSYVIVSVIGTGIFAYYTRKHFGYTYSEMLKDFLPAVGLAGAMCLLMLSINKWSCNLWMKLLFQILAGIVFYLMGSYFMRFESFFLIGKLLRRIKR